MYVSVDGRSQYVRNISGWHSGVRDETADVTFNRAMMLEACMPTAERDTNRNDQVQMSCQELLNYLVLADESPAGFDLVLKESVVKGRIKRRVPACRQSGRCIR